MSLTLTSVTVSIPAGTTTPQAVGGVLDYLYEGNQDRRLVGQLGAAGDSLLFEGTLDGTNWWPLGAAITGDVLGHAILVEGPLRQIRATKTGTAGIATVTAVI
jgi:hypothetical protein